MERVSDVKFEGRARVHLGLEVAAIEPSIEFYRTLLGVEPTKRRPGYARFEPLEPNLNLSLSEGLSVPPRTGGFGHFGVQVGSSAAVEEAAARLSRAGYETRFERDEGCCYALQDKVWVEDPDGNRWEVFCTLHDDDERRHSSAVESASSESCCAES